MSAPEETYLDLPPQCFVKGCNRTFEGHVPENWLEREVSFVTTAYGDDARPIELVPCKAGLFFCPEHAPQLAQIEDLSDVIEPTPEGGFTINLDDD